MITNLGRVIIPWRSAVAGAGKPVSNPSMASLADLIIDLFNRSCLGLCSPDSQNPIDFIIKIFSLFYRIWLETVNISLGTLYAMWIQMQHPIMARIMTIPPLTTTVDHPGLSNAITFPWTIQATPSTARFFLDSRLECRFCGWDCCILNHPRLGTGPWIHKDAIQSSKFNKVDPKVIM